MKKKIYKIIKDIIIKDKTIEENKQEQITFVETDNLERNFPIEVLASHFEQRLLNINCSQLTDFWNFITNEDVNISNINRFESIITNEIYRQHPNFKILDINKYFLTDVEINYLIDWYKTMNGSTIRIKSVKKGYTKSLKMQDK